MLIFLLFCCFSASKTDASCSVQGFCTSTSQYHYQEAIHFKYGKNAISQKHELSSNFRPLYSYPFARNLLNDTNFWENCPNY